MLTPLRSLRELFRGHLPLTLHKRVVLCSSGFSFELVRKTPLVTDDQPPGTLSAHRAHSMLQAFRHVYMRENDISSARGLNRVAVEPERNMGLVVHVLPFINFHAVIVGRPPTQIGGQ